RLVGKCGDHDRDRHAWLHTLGLRVKRFAEFHDIETALTQCRADWRRWICLTSWHLQLDKANDFLGHNGSYIGLSGSARSLSCDTLLRLLLYCFAYDDPCGPSRCNPRLNFFDLAEFEFHRRSTTENRD